MKLNSDSGDLLEIEPAHSGADAHGVLVVIRARFRGFLAEIDAWVQREAWMGFTQTSSFWKSDATEKQGLRGSHPENCRSSSGQRIALGTWASRGRSAHGATTTTYRCALECWPSNPLGSQRSSTARERIASSQNSAG